MLLIKTKLGLSQIHGIGLIADQFITQGTIIWIHDDGIDRIYRHDKLSNLLTPAKETILTYGWREGKYHILPGDNARFTNHSSSPNCKIDIDGNSFAIRDILPGEEITEDYTTFDDDHLIKLAH